MTLIQLRPVAATGKQEKSTPELLQLEEGGPGRALGLGTSGLRRGRVVCPLSMPVCPPSSGPCLSGPRVARCALRAPGEGARRLGGGRAAAAQVCYLHSNGKRTAHGMGQQRPH